MKKIVTFLMIFAFLGCADHKVHTTNAEFYDFDPIYIKAQNTSSNIKTKFYNFDDLLINGQYKKPQVLYTDSKQKVKFGRLLKLKKDFLPKLKNSSKDPLLR